jgi:UDP-glucose 4-epimerase
MTQWENHFQDKFKGVKTVVTGGAGFIGSHLSDALLSLGAHVTVIDDLSGGLQSNIDFLNKAHPSGKLEFIKASILDEAAIARAVQNARYVFHQAALGSVPRSLREPELYMQVNIVGTLKVLMACKQAGVQRVTFAASSSAYGDTPTLPKFEEMPVLPKSPYAVSKVACEGLMRTFALSYGLDTVSLRYFNIFGPRQNANSAYAAVIAAFAKALGNGQNPVIFGDGTQSRDFTFVDNAVYANLLGATADHPLAGAVVNVACARQVTVTELARKMAELYNRPDLAAHHKPDRPGDVKHSLASLKNTQKTIDYQPLVDFDEGLKQTVSWYKSQNLNIV